MITVNLLLAGCAGAPVASIQRTEEKKNDFVLAEKVVRDLFDIYQDFTMKKFSDAVADDFVPMRSDFINTASRNTSKTVLVEVTFSLEQVLSNKDTLAIEIKWQKHSQSYGDTSVGLTQGRANLVFKNKPGRWQLYQVSGDNPF